jgi:3'(2'), 5'-bisphosphate nucleotidase
MAKYDESPLTTADLIANEIICNGLNTISSFPIVSEENIETPYEQRTSFEYFWLIDPIDGTKEFIKKNDQFTINIALVHKEEVIMGIVVAPAIQESYYAVKSHGAFLEKNGRKCRLSCSEYKPTDEGLRIPVSMSHINADTLQYLSQYNNPVQIPAGAALKFMMVASAQADLYPRLAPTMEWDTAAPQIIVEEAGGTLIDCNTGLPMKYNKKSLVNPGFITYSKKLE